MTKSHLPASSAPTILIVRASPSYRSMKTPLAWGNFLSGSASTTSPTVHFQPLPACLYTDDLLISSLKADANSGLNALIFAISASLLRSPTKVTGPLAPREPGEFRLAGDLDRAAAPGGGFEVAGPPEGAGRAPGADGAAPDLDRPVAVPRRGAGSVVVRAHPHNILSPGPTRNTTFGPCQLNLGRA